MTGQFSEYESIRQQLSDLRIQLSIVIQERDNCIAYLEQEKITNAELSRTNTLQ